MIFVTGNVLLIVVPYLLCEFPVNLVGDILNGLFRFFDLVSVFFLGFGYYGYPLFEIGKKQRDVDITFSVDICLIPVFLQGKITFGEMGSNPFFMVFLTGTSGDAQSLDG